MSGYGIKEGDFRFVWDDTQKGGTLVQFARRRTRYTDKEQVQDVAVARVAWDENIVRTTTTDAAPRLRANSEVGDCEVRENAKFWRALDNAVRAVEKVNAPSGGRLHHPQGATVGHAPTDAHIVEVVARSIMNDGAVSAALTSRFSVESHNRNPA